MLRRTTLARYCCLAPFFIAGLVGGCTKGGGLVEGFGSYTGPGADDGGTDDGDDGDDDDDDDGGEDPSGPVDEGGEDPSGVDDGDPPAGEGDCCVGHETPGCADMAIAECVCAQDDFCCTSVWDDLCASLVVENGCGVCMPGGDDSGAETGGGEESGGVESGGVEEGGVEEGGVEEGGVEEGGAEAGGGMGECVCEQDDFCCTTEWDDLCVGEVDEFGCGAC